MPQSAFETPPLVVLNGFQPTAEEQEAEAAAAAEAAGTDAASGTGAGAAPRGGG